MLVILLWLNGWIYISAYVFRFLSAILLSGDSSILATSGIGSIFVSHGCSESECAEEILAMFWWIEVEAILDCAQLNPGMKGNVDRYW